MGVSSWLEPLGWTLETMTSVSVILKKSTPEAPPALRQVSTASLMCCPVAQAIISLGVALSTLCTKVRSPMLTRPAPPPVLEAKLVVWVMPQLKLSHMIWPAKSLCSDMPGMVSILM